MIPRNKDASDAARLQQGSQRNDDAPACIAADIPCMICGYNLRTLATNATCPECGHDVQQSFHRHEGESLPDWHENGVFLARAAGATMTWVVLMTIVIWHVPPAAPIALILIPLPAFVCFILCVDLTAHEAGGHTSQSQLSALVLLLPICSVLLCLVAPSLLFDLPRRGFAIVIGLMASVLPAWLLLVAVGMRRLIARPQTSRAARLARWTIQMSIGVLAIVVPVMVLNELGTVHYLPHFIYVHRQHIQGLYLYALLTEALLLGTSLLLLGHELHGRRMPTNAGTSTVDTPSISPAGDGRDD